MVGADAGQSVELLLGGTWWLAFGSLAWSGVLGYMPIISGGGQERLYGVLGLEYVCSHIYKLD